MNLAIFNEIITNGYKPEILDVFSLAAILSGILVIINKNPIVSICAPLWLSFVCVSISLLDREFFIRTEESTNREIENTINPQYWCKPTNLPTSENYGGQQHVSKGGNKSRVNSEDALLGKTSMIHKLFLTGADTNPTSQLNNTSKWILDGRNIGLSKRGIHTEIQKGLEKESKDIIKDEGAVNAGSPKSGNGHGDGEPIVAISRMQTNSKGVQLSISSLHNSESTSMEAGEHEQLEELFSLLTHGKIREYDLMYQKVLYKMAYERLKSKPGNMTHGADQETLDGFSMEWIGKTIEQLKNQSFQFKPVRREYIPKPNGKKRPLGIPSPRDKIVQEVMKNIIEAIFEPTFSNHSHGFRPKRSCHTALEEVSKWNGVNWAIEGDIKGFFDNVDHEKLAGMLKNRIKDQRIIDLFWKLVRAGYVEKGRMIDNSLGVPQGGLISPLLSNIYLDLLDKYVEILKIQYETPKGKRTTLVSPQYQKMTRELKKLTDQYELNPSTELIREIKALRLLRAKIPSRVGIGMRLRYVRYADDWIIGITGSKKVTMEIKNKIGIFLKESLGLDMSEEKTKITYLKQEEAKFLGTLISRIRSKEAKVVNKKTSDNVTKLRISQVRPKLKAPIKEILEKLEMKGFIKRNDRGEMIPSAMNKWINLEHRDILIRYNWVIRGYMNYYSFVDNYSRLGGSVVNFMLVHSCAKTLALKYKLRSRKEVFKKFGKYLTPADELTQVSAKKMPLRIEYQDSLAITRKFKINRVNDPMEVLNWGLRTSKGFLESPCWICGAEDNIQMHHLKHIRKMNETLAGFSKIMAQINRKQIPVCIKCHQKIHVGKYDGLALKDLKKFNNADNVK